MAKRRKKFGVRGTSRERYCAREALTYRGKSSRVRAFVECVHDYEYSGKVPSKAELKAGRQLIKRKRLFAGR